MLSKCISVLAFLLLKITNVPSAKFPEPVFERHSLKSLICNRNKRGPRVEPWGTPHVTLAREESKPFNETNCFLLFR